VKRLVKHEAARQTKRPPEGGLSVALIEIEIRLRPARRSVSPRHLIKGPLAIWPAAGRAQNANGI